MTCGSASRSSQWRTAASRRPIAGASVGRAAGAGPGPVQTQPRSSPPRDRCRERRPRSCGGCLARLVDDLDAGNAAPDEEAQQRGRRRAARGTRASPGVSPLSGRAGAPSPQPGRTEPVALGECRVEAAQALETHAWATWATGRAVSVSSCLPGAAAACARTAAATRRARLRRCAAWRSVMPRWRASGQGPAAPSSYARGRRATGRPGGRASPTRPSPTTAGPAGAISGRHFRHGRNAADSAWAGDAKKRQFSRRGVRTRRSGGSRRRWT